MGSKHKRNPQEYGPDPYENFDDDMIDDFDDFDDLTKDFYSTDWENPAGTKRRGNARRKIERRNELKDLFMEFDDWDDYDLRNDW